MKFVKFTLVTSKDTRRVAIDIERIRHIMELPEGTYLADDGNGYVVKENYNEVMERIKVAK